MAKYIVTIAPPTPNGDLHLGHISGPFLAADVFARVRKLRNDDVVFVCYSDDYQDYVARMAVQQGKDKFDLATHFGQRIENTLKKCGIELDWFLKAYNNDYYKNAVKLFYTKALEKGVLSKETASVPYSEEDNTYGYEAFARGICNYCGEESDASQCEACAFAPIMEEMGVLTSILTKQPMTYVDQEREYLRLGEFVNYLKEQYVRNPSVREHLGDYLQEVLSSDNLNWFIDRPGGNGVDIDVDGAKKIIHTWFSGLAGYYAATNEYANHVNQPLLHQRFWEDKDTTVVNFLGFDCSFSHAIVYPALLSNVDNHTNNIIPITNKFLKLEGKDFSTSRRHAIWADEILEEVSVDALRFYLALVSPEEEIRNFEKDKFIFWKEEFYQPSVDGIENLLNGKKDWSFDSHLLTYQQEKELLKFRDKWDHFSATANFSIGKIADTLQDLLSLVNILVKEKSSMAATAAQLYLVMAKPIHPALSEKLIARYQIDEKAVSDWLFPNYDQLAARA